MLQWSRFLLVVHHDMDNYDVEAQALMRETAEASRQLMLKHLEEHLIRNPDSTYTSWIAALHPENVQLDQRMSQDGNEWLRAWQTTTTSKRTRSSCLGARVKLQHFRRKDGVLRASFPVIVAVAHLALAVAFEALRLVCLSLASCCTQVALRIPSISIPTTHKLESTFTTKL